MLEARAPQPQGAHLAGRVTSELLWACRSVRRLPEPCDVLPQVSDLSEALP